MPASTSIKLSSKDKFQIVFGDIKGLLLPGLVFSYFLFFTDTNSEEVKIGLIIITSLVDLQILISLISGLKTIFKCQKILLEGRLVNAQLSEARDSGKDQSGNKRYELTYVYEAGGQNYELHTRSNARQYQYPTLEIFYAKTNPATGLFLISLPEFLADKIRAQFQNQSQWSY